MKSEDLRLNIIVNGDAGRKEILDTEKAISKLKSEIKSLKKTEGDHSKEISETNKRRTEAKSKYAELQRQMNLDQKTMAELKKFDTRTAQNELLSWLAWVVNLDFPARKTCWSLFPLPTKSMWH